MRRFSALLFGLVLGASFVLGVGHAPVALADGQWGTPTDEGVRKVLRQARTRPAFGTSAPETVWVGFKQSSSDVNKVGVGGLWDFDTPNSGGGNIADTDSAQFWFFQQAPNANDGTVITAVNGDGSVATITPGAKAAGTGSVVIGWAVVSERNPNVPGVVGSGSGTQYNGVRFSYAIIRPDAPSYVAARNIVGFNDVSGGVVSDVCNGNDAGIIEDYGFLPLTPLEPTGPGVGNDSLITCRKQ